MRKPILKFFDEFCYGELVIEKSDDPNWVKPNIPYDAFGYSTDDHYLFYNGDLMDNVNSMFGIGRDDFKRYLKEWFEDRYNLPVFIVL